MNSLDIVEDTDLETLSHRALCDMPRVRPVLDQIADKWTILILIVLCPKPTRFNELKRRLGRITHKALTPIGVEYAITPLGHSLRQPFEALCAWALAHGDAILQHSQQAGESHSGSDRQNDDGLFSDAVSR
jgi:DNA-binding HxlR family transcriptional regulator